MTVCLRCGIALLNEKDRPYTRLKYCSRRCGATATFTPCALCNQRIGKGLHKCPASKTPLQRLEAHITKTASCWLWTGELFNNGYGCVSMGCKKPKKFAHRLAYETAIGPIPGGMLVCHHCDVRNCVRPDHLFVGTHKDNARDMDLKGRRKLCPMPGEKNPAAKLTWKIVREIRRAHSYRDGEKLAKRFKISHSMVLNIVNNLAWKEPDVA